ncbi:hypothetical protein FACS1894187_16320 [Synergistales bacterium]|nr:hypothetical protein FACS1894187_16320 [Synergistales bacterium]
MFLVFSKLKTKFCVLSQPSARKRTCIKTFHGGKMASIKKWGNSNDCRVASVIKMCDNGENLA